MQFSDLIGNASVSEILQKAIATHTVPNTLLFSGSEGIGKTLFAKVLASHLLYPNGMDAIQKEKIFSKNTHPDLHILQPEGKWFTIAAIRYFLEESSLLPFESSAKVFLFFDAEKMHTDCANALLKTLEEPTLDSYVILMTSKEEELLPTIRSRCIRVPFSQPSEADIISFLQRKSVPSTAEIKRLAPLALGSFRRAHQLATDPKFLEKRELLANLLSAFSYDIWEKFSKTLEDEEFLDWEEIFSFILFWYRDLHLLQETKNSKNAYLTPYLSQLQKIKNFPSLENVHHWLEQVKEGLDRNIKAKVCLEELFFKLHSDNFTSPSQFRAKGRKVVVTM
ncbi:MAG: AAA family ATPase [Chlamydiota bacterium]